MEPHREEQGFVVPHLSDEVEVQWELDEPTDYEPQLDSGHVCAYCADELELLDEIYLLEIAHVAADQGALHFFTVQGANGDYQFMPHMFHLQCWEELVEDLKDLIEDEPPLPIAEVPIHQCAWCKSPMPNWATVALLHFGELRRSDRTPNGEREHFFCQVGESDKVICTHCIERVNEDLLEMWEGHE